MARAWILWIAFGATWACSAPEQTDVPATGATATDVPEECREPYQRYQVDPSGFDAVYGCLAAAKLSSEFQLTAGSELSREGVEGVRVFVTERLRPVLPALSILKSADGEQSVEVHAQVPTSERVHSMRR